MRALPFVVLLTPLLSLAAEVDPPAEVEAHDLAVVVDGGGRLTTSQTWRVRLTSPERASAGLPAPQGLDGASSGGATVIGDLLVAPPDAAIDATYALGTTARQYRGPYSGVFRTAPDLPVREATARVQVPSWIPATVWFDPGGAPSFEHTRSTRAASVRWDDIGAGASAELVWTTWKSWDDAGDALVRQVTPKLADKRGLGREFAQDIEGISVAEIVARVNRVVRVYPEDYGSWDAARPATKVLADGEGSAAERGVVLLSMLRAAGHDARPALFRSADTGGAPILVPAPAQLDRPAVAVVSAKRVLWIDLASAYTALPDVPAAMVGGVAWVPGHHPTPLGVHGPMDGLVTVNAQIRIGQDGKAPWTAQISATGVAREWLRARLAPLPEDARSEALLRLIQLGRAGTSRVSVSFTGVEDPQRPLRIAIQGHDEGVFEVIASGGLTAIPPVIGPGLASWLPTRILVHEELSIEPPAGVAPIATLPARPVVHSGVVLTQVVRRDGARLILTTEALRPERSDSPARATEAARFLEQHASDAPRVAWFGMPTPPATRALAGDERIGSVADRAALEVLWWLSASDVTRSRNALKKALKQESAAAVAWALRQRAPTEDPRPWRSLHEASSLSSVRIEAVEGLLRAGEVREAWLGAAALASEPEPSIRARALGVMYRAQPEQRPDEKSDRAGHRAWAPRQDLLTRAQEAAAAAGRDAAILEAPVVLARARRDLDHGRVDEALALLDDLTARGREPVAIVLAARARAQRGAAAQDVADAIRDGVDDAPFDDEVLAEASRAMEAVGRVADALGYALAAARIGAVDPAAWATAARLAVAHGDLPTAVYAARRASDLAPGDPQHGEALRQIATWLGDQESAALGASRVPGGGQPSWPAGLDAILADTPPEALLAVLQHHEDEVVASARLLATRGQLRLEAGRLDDAARDGLILATRHGDARGHALAFAATAGRLWASSGADALGAAVGDSGVRALRMEYALVAGSSDPLVDARALAGDEPRADLLVRAAKDGAAQASEVEGWPDGLKDPSVKGPPTWRHNALLGAAPGVVAWSHADLAASVLFVDAPDNILPPPLSLLWTPGERDLATLADGGRLLRLEGGALPVYAASQRLDGRRAWAIGFTPESAQRALRIAEAAWRAR